MECLWTVSILSVVGNFLNNLNLENLSLNFDQIDDLSGVDCLCLKTSAIPNTSYIIVIYKIKHIQQ